jgi:uncharacterized membrane protein HdeD (DUF308 family)
MAGILAFVIGGILLWAPAKYKIETYLILVMAIGLFFLIEGILQIVALFLDHSWWGLKLLLGILGIWLGTWVLAYPVAAGVIGPKLDLLFLGIWGFVSGVAMLVMAIRGGGWGAGILGVLSLIFGTVLMMNYYAIGLGLTYLWICAWAGVIFGVVLIVQAFRQRSAA